MKQADVFNIIKDKSGRVYSRREIDHAIKLLFPGVVKKPMKIAKKMNRKKMEDKKINDRSGILSLAFSMYG